jgi:SulP family sulfate permease
MFVTLGLTVFLNLITAVAVGLTLAAFVTTRWMEREEIKGVTAIVIADGNQGLDDSVREALGIFNGQIGLVFFFAGSDFYASARALNRRVGRAVLGHQAVIYDFT